jgi:Ca2+-binding RTX toxin-like protein
MTLINASNATEAVNISATSDQFDFLVRDPDGNNSSTLYSWLTTNTGDPDDVQAFGTGIDVAFPSGLIDRIDIDLSNDGDIDIRFNGITASTGNDDVKPARLSVITDGASAFFNEILSFADGITGSRFNDTLHGGAGKDGLFGRDGADVLRGDSGNDVLNGGAGADNLGGGSGRDRFEYISIADSAGQSTDTIIGFLNPGNAAGDKIDVSAIDADQRAGSGGNQTFDFVGEVDEGVLTPAGSVYVRTSGSSTLFLANVDDDAKAEWGVRVNDGSVSPDDYKAEDLIL